MLAQAPSVASNASLHEERDAVNLSGSDVRELVTDYLYYIHDRPHSLFHPDSLWDDIRQRRIGDGLLYAICSLASSLSPHAEVHRLGPQLANRSRELLLADLENVCLEHVQTCVILANVFAAELEPSSEALYFGIANRMAHLLRLHTPISTDDAILREIKLRVWWTLVMADQWCSSGLDIPRQLNGHFNAVALPMDEGVFHDMRPGGTGSLQSDHRVGLWGHMITLVEIFSSIHDLNRRAVADPGLTDVQSGTAVAGLAHRLDDWVAALPDDARLDVNDDNLEYHRSRGFGGAFVALHLGYHHYSTLLYFPYLDIHRATDHVSEEFSQRCKYHASAYSQLLAQSRELEGCAAVYATVGHMTVVSSCVLLHALLFGTQEQLQTTRALLLLNFAALIDLRKLWPSLERTARSHLVQRKCMEHAR